MPLNDPDNTIWYVEASFDGMEVSAGSAVDIDRSAAALK